MVQESLKILSRISAVVICMQIHKQENSLIASLYSKIFKL